MKTPQLLHIRCATVEETRRVVGLLLDRQVGPGDIEVISSEPIQDVAAMISGRSRLPAFVVSGAFAGILAGSLMVTVTSRLYPINTGGMPIVSLLPVGIVTYETMMLLAILFTLAGLLLEARLLWRLNRRLPFPMEPDVDECIHVFAQIESPNQVQHLGFIMERTDAPNEQ